MSDQFQFSDEEFEQLRAMFFEQATEVIDSLGGLILRVERDPGDTEALRSIRRAVHTLKGDSTAFGFTELTQLAHRYEDALDRVGNKQDVTGRYLIDLLLAGSDTLAEFIKYYQGEASLPDTTALIIGLEALSESLDASVSVPLEPEAALAPSTATAELAGPEIGAPVEAAQPIAAAPPAKPRRVRKPAAQKPPASRRKAAAPDAPVTELAAAEPAQAASSTAPAPVAPKPEMEPYAKGLAEEAQRQEQRASSKPAAPTLRVESERIDTAMNLVGELIIQRSMIASLAAEVEALQRGNECAHQLVDAVALLGRTLSELQESVMCMRLVAIDLVFRRFPRVVRDASVKLDKPLRLEIIGGDTEIDKSIVEVISDPLIHLVRNACDHGIEAPAVRRAAGKPAEGVIKLTARRAGNQIAVEVEDDGGGMDPERIVRKAIQKGLVSAAEVTDWTEQQKIGLIFAPGFSTAETISDMSGRGVGLDVVKSTVDDLGGSVTINSVLGQGSRFIIKLPLTMAIVRAMLFETAGQRFALPLDGIREITCLRADETKTINGREVLRLRDQVLPLIRVDEALGLRALSAPRANSRSFVFVLDLGDGREVGLAVERLHGEQELVLKTVDEALTQSDLVAGASILGDGQVVLILDPYATIERAKLGRQTEVLLPPPGPMLPRFAASGPH
jgi:two-component system chemotaxis sensor kinase CheA